MADEIELFYEIDVDCPHCKAKQLVRMKSGPGPALQTISCIKCQRDFDVNAPDQIVGGPFPA
jgi:hypothetical protein